MSELPEDLLSFIETSLGQIFSARKLYPDDVFETQNFAGVPLSVIVDEGLRNYIHEAVHSLLNLSVDVNYLVCTLVSSSDRPLDSYAFCISPLTTSYHSSNKYEDLKLAFAQLSLVGLNNEPLTEDCSFKLQIVGNLTAPLTSSNWALDSSLPNNSYNRAQPLPLSNVQFGSFNCMIIKDFSSTALGNR
ncbi:hypothetical protein RCL1_005443 [Eukaryota sp. TZLM3-RCL]